MVTAVFKGIILLKLDIAISEINPISDVSLLLFALIGWIMMSLTPALLGHKVKDTAQDTLVGCISS